LSLKSIISALLVGAALIYFEVLPADFVDRGANTWDRFSGDFMALIHGDALAKSADENKVTADGVVQSICNKANVEGDDESAVTARQIDHDRCEQIKNSKFTIVDPEELKRRWTEYQKHAD
jgi:hypothetical protein